MFIACLVDGAYLLNPTTGMEPLAVRLANVGAAPGMVWVRNVEVK
jgi:hypothetical protein